MKAFFAALAAFVVAGLIASAVNYKTTRVYTLTPGQSLQLSGLKHAAYIRAEYPVSIRQGNCFIPHTAEGPANCAPDVLVVTDARPVALVWAHTNRVSVTASAF